MSILGSSINKSGKMEAPFFHEFKKQASFFFKEKIKTARLALTDVTPAQLMTEEATNGNTWAPDARTLKIISLAAFEVDDYWRIVEILHKRLSRFDRKNWRMSYNSLIVVEHLLTHGPESASEEFQSDVEVIREMQSFQHIDEKGFNWGLNVRKISDRILKLLEKGPLLKEERDRARKLTRGIQGFGSFCQRSSSTQGILHESDSIYGRSNSQFNDHGSEDDENFAVEDEDLIRTSPSPEKPNDTYKGNFQTVAGNKPGNLSSKRSFKENIVPAKREVVTEDLNEWNCTGEINPLLCKNDKMVENFGEEDHPFNENQHHASLSLLSDVDQPLQAYSI